MEIVINIKKKLSRIFSPKLEELTGTYECIYLSRPSIYKTSIATKQAQSDL